MYVRRDLKMQKYIPAGIFGVMSFGSQVQKVMFAAFSHMTNLILLKTRKFI
jgi:hypothetical protein